jgi:hypothetical protein
MVGDGFTAGSADGRCVGVELASQVELVRRLFRPLCLTRLVADTQWRVNPRVELLRMRAGLLGACKYCHFVT